MNDEVGREIGSGLGEVLDVDVKAINSKRACFLQVRIDDDAEIVSQDVRPDKDRSLLVSALGYNKRERITGGVLPTTPSMIKLEKLSKRSKVEKTKMRVELSIIA
nr:hypothetical protein CFP56_60129 [Quercus suber]